MSKFARYVLVTEWRGRDGIPENEFGTLIARTASDAFEQLLDKATDSKRVEQLMARLWLRHFDLASADAIESRMVSLLRIVNPTNDVAEFKAKSTDGPYTFGGEFLHVCDFKNDEPVPPLRIKPTQT